jgi:hypothetical protein
MTVSFGSEKQKGRANPASPCVSMIDASTSVVKDQKRNPLRSLKVFGGALAVPLVLHKIEADLLALCERGHASALDCGDVDKNVVAAIIGAMKPKPLVELKNFTVPVFITISFQSVIDDHLHAKMRQTVQIDFERGRSPKARSAPETKFNKQDRSF